VGLAWARVGGSEAFCMFAGVFGEGGFEMKGKQGQLIEKA